MSNVNNLHSLFQSKWMITDEFANSLYPYLINILSKGSLDIKSTIESECFMYAFANGSQASENSSLEKSVAILPIKGPILKYSQECGPTGTKDMMKKMDVWKYEDHIAGVLLDMDTAGGQVIGTPEFSEYVYIYNQTKPVLVYTDGTIASAGLYIAAGAKEIFANKHAMAIGSIGTMSKSINTDGIIEKLGGKVIEAYASDSTHKNLASREAAKGNLKPLIENELNPINGKFKNEILEYRPSIKPEALNGMHTYNIEEAKELGLIDTIGTKQDAINRIFELADQNTNTNKESDMSQETNYSNIADVVGLEELTASKKILSGKTGVFLTVAQLGLLNEKLGDHKGIVDGLQNTVDANTEKITNLSSENTSLTTAVSKALKVAGLEASETPEASIEAIGAKVAEYGAQPGATGTTVTSTGDRTDEEPESSAIWDSLNVK